MKQQERDDIMFNLGILAALAVVALHDAQTIFDEIVDSADAAQLVAVARDDEQLEISGLAKYGYDKKYPSVKRAPRRKRAHV